MIQITPKYTAVEETYAALRKHINSIWPENVKEEYVHKEGPMRIMLPNWRVIEIAPMKAKDPWVYVSLGAWEVTKDELYESGRYGLDFLITSPERNLRHIKTLATVAVYHSEPKTRINLQHVIDIGEPRIEGSKCDHFLVSLPHLFPPEIETILVNDIYISFWWLLPITKKEADYAEKHGVEALEEIFEKKRINTVDVKRKSAVSSFWR